MTISSDQINHIARLARLKTDPEQAEFYAGQLTRIVPGFRVEREPGRLRLTGDGGQTLELQLDAAGRVARAVRGDATIDYRYDDAGHGFFYYHRPMYRVEQAMDGWEKIFAFFSKHLSA